MTAATKRSAGLLMYRVRAGQIEVFLVHPGGAFFVHRDDGYWGVPKGLIEEGESLLDVAVREFEEETGRSAERCRTAVGTLALGKILQRGGKRVHAWAFEGDWPDGVEVRSNTFELEWPRGSGQFVEIPEVDDGRFFAMPDARRKISDAQEAFLDRLLEILGA